MREFRPPVRPSVLRVVLAVVLPLVVLAAVGSVLALSLGITQASYTIAGGALVIRSGDLLTGERTVRLADVTEARAVVLLGGRRTRGTALPGFCAGRFSYPELGTVWQVTNCGPRAVVVRQAGDAVPIVLTPPDPRDFVDKLRAGTDTVVVLPPPDKSQLNLIVLIVAPLSGVAVIMVSLLLLIGPGRMRYLVGDGAIEVRTLFGRKRWQTAGARAKTYRPSRLWRVAGTAAPGYYTGIFREDGQSTRVYATRIDQGVLLEGPARVFLSPADPEAMLRALAEEGVEIPRRPS
ncbi:MAG: PH domain-containing protein [Minicystis sp.]